MEDSYRWLTGSDGYLLCKNMFWWNLFPSGILGRHRLRIITRKAACRSTAIVLSIDLGSVVRRVTLLSPRSGTHFGRVKTSINN